MLHGERPSSAEVGTVLGGTYRLDRLIGEGGMGSVYEASHTRVPRKFAIKLLNPDVISNREVFERFRREAELTSSLGHENIVQVFDFNHTEQGVPYMVLELLVGEDLANRIRNRGRLTLEQTWEIVEQVGGALEAAHAAGIVHRDLKPQNIFMCMRPGRDDVAKVLDFGISKVLHAPSHGTRTGLIMGTPNYMSPEQAEGRVSEIDARTDLFAFATIVYECLTGRMVFDAPTPVGTIYQVCHGIPDPIRAYAPEVPEAIERVLLCAMAKRRDERYQTILAFMNDFQRALTGQSAQMPTVMGPQSSSMATVQVRQSPTTLSGAASEMRSGPSSYVQGPQSGVQGPQSGVQGPQSGVQGPQSGVQGPQSGVQGPQSGVQAPQSGVQAPKKSKAALIAVLGLVVVGGGIGAAVALGGGGGGAKDGPPGIGASAAQPEETPAETAPPVETKPETKPVETKPVETKPVETTPEVKPEPPPAVKLALEIQPKGAVVEVDGLVVKTNPLELPKSETPVKIVIRADGYVTETREVKPILDGELVVSLKKARGSSSGKKKKNIGPVEEDL